MIKQLSIRQVLSLRYLRLFIVIVATVMTPTVFANLISQVDRTNISLDDTLTLTVRLSNKDTNSAPDFSVLETQFDIISQHEGSQVRVVNGNVNAFKEWTLTLLAKRAGQLIIPAFKHEGFVSQPINISVSTQENRSAGDLKDMFVETVIDKQDAYVQEQIVIHYRLHFNQNLEAFDTEELALDSATVVRLEDTSYQRRIDGRIYSVADFSYAIYPQESGELIIPRLNWKFKVYDSQRRSFFSSGNYKVKRVTTAQKTIQVKPVPQSFPQGATWLPAKQIDISDNWSQSLTDVTQGTPVTRTVTLQAEGLMSSQLPEIISNSQSEKLKIYAEQPNQTQVLSNESVNSERVESAAYIAAAAGQINIPQTSIPWWDTTENRLKYATLPGQTIQVKGGNPISTAPAVTQTYAPSSAVAQPRLDSAPHEDASQVAFWKGLTILFGILWLITLAGLIYIKQRSVKTSNRSQSPTDQTIPQRLKAFKLACQSGDPQAIQTSLADLVLQLKKSEPGYQQSSTNEYLAKKYKNPDLNDAIKRLDQHLYSTAPAEFADGNVLYRHIERSLKDAKREDIKDQSLAPLYIQ